MASTSGRKHAGGGQHTWAGVMKRTLDDMNAGVSQVWEPPDTDAERFPLPDQQAYDRYQELAADMTPKQAMARAAAEGIRRYDSWQEFTRYAAAARTPDGAWIYTVGDALSAAAELARGETGIAGDWSPTAMSDLFRATRLRVMSTIPVLKTAVAREAAIKTACELYNRRQVEAFGDYRVATDRAWQDYQRAMHAASDAYDTAMADAGTDYDETVSRNA